MADEELILPPEENEPETEEGSSFKLDLYYWIQALVMALVAIILLFTLAGRIIGVEGNSMVPTLHNGDLLLLRSVAYTPEQGDVVVLRKPTFLAEPIVKRVIAVGGQHVRVDHIEGTVTVDGVVLDEPYINEIMVETGDPHKTVLDVTVPEGSIYVLGDNRNHSSDSRDNRLATVDERYVLGQAVWTIFPFSSFGAVE